MTPTQMKANTRLAQEAWDHLSYTGKKSTNEYGTCTYGGSGCAFFPALLPNFPKEIEGKSARDIISNTPQYLKAWARNCQTSFAAGVQCTHDNSPAREEFLDMFAKRLRRTCNAYNVPVPKGCLDYIHREDKI